METFTFIIIIAGFFILILFLIKDLFVPADWYTLISIDSENKLTIIKETKANLKKLIEEEDQYYIVPDIKILASHHLWTGDDRDFWK